MRDGLERCAGNDAERDDAGRVAVHDGDHIGARAVNLAVDKAFEIGARRVGLRRVAVEIELDDIGGRDKRRRHAARDQEVVRILRMPRADMAEAIDDALLVEDVIGIDEIVEDGGINF